MQDYLGAIKAHKYFECRFEKCTNPIIVSKSYFDDDNDEPCIDNCVFVECTDVIDADDNTQITNCQFVACYDDLIRPYGYDGGISVEFCQFINTRNTKESIISRRISCITFTRTKSSKTRVNYLKKCIFDGVDLGSRLVIKASVWEKAKGVVTYIENCDFKNCSTQRASGKIIKEYIQYDTLFKKDVNFHANIISDCRGLDKINKEGSKSESVEIRSTLNVGVSGDVGAPAALLQCAADN